MKLFKVAISDEQLRAIPAEDRNVLLLLGHVLNEINIIRKTALVSIGSILDHEDLGRAGVGQAALFVRLLGGKTHEAWEVFRTRFHSDPVLGPKYGPRLQDRVGETVKKLNVKFSSSNFLATLRNSHAFHYPDTSDLADAFEAMAAPEGWIWYMSDVKANTYPYASDVVAIAASFRVFNPSDAAAATELFTNDVIGTAADVEAVLDAVVEIIMREHFEKSLRLAPIVAGPEGLHWRDIRLPFFWADELADK